MVWYRLYRVSACFGGVVLCGGCVARTCLTQSATDQSSDLTEIDELANLTLRQVQVFFRHGARTPIHLTPNVEQGIYRKDIHNRIVPHTAFDVKLKSLDGEPLEASPYEKHYSQTILRGGCILGSLTRFGEQQTYDLGRRLRLDYIERHGLLNKVFIPEEIYIRSTNINRTINSARCVMAGLYGIEELSRNGDACIHISKVKNEVLLPNPHNCALVRSINHAALIHFDNIPGIKTDRIHLQTTLGVSSDKPSEKLNFIDVRDDIIARQAHGLPVPNVLIPLVDLIDRNATRIMYHATCGQHELCQLYIEGRYKIFLRLISIPDHVLQELPPLERAWKRAERHLALRMTAGPAMTLAVDKMKSFISGRSKHKICLYSAHDSLILPLTVILDMFDWKWPPFVADIRLELYTDRQNDYWVRVLYCGKVQRLRGCESTVCRYSQFLENMQPFLIHEEEYIKVCSSNILEKIAKDLLVHEKGEEKEERSDVPAGL